MSKFLVLVSSLALIGTASATASNEVVTLDTATKTGGGSVSPQIGLGVLPSDPEATQAQVEKCRDHISQARKAIGQSPLLEREPASPEKPYAIYAVHREQDGCSVMVMMGSQGDIQPLPSADPNGPYLLPAKP
ncbi:hypothetical protein [Erythrobacter longus]|nr:hypothetical protein [Erythrobacter longus]